MCKSINFLYLQGQVYAPEISERVSEVFPARPFPIGFGRASCPGLYMFDLHFSEVI